MKGCVFLTARDAGYGFGLAGFRQIVVEQGTVLAEIEKIVHDKAYGLVIIDERLLSEAEADRLSILEKSWDGAVVILPAPTDVEADAAQDYGTRLIARVLGYQVKLS